MSVRDQLSVTGSAFKNARAELDAARAEVQPLIVKALREGMAQSEIVRLSGYTRETVRRLARTNGIKS
jgi:hypothetical protein